ncbi:MAG: hypothetical protein JSW39_29690 [Desulfobacterales bacterium]|nr:MAG: hypothetical protein JSW39_29690 [Desulfobacterales bacterium]
MVQELGESLSYEKIITKEPEGAARYRTISMELGRPAPVPAILIEGKLIFDSTPGQEELKAYLAHLITPADETVGPHASG